MLTDEREVYWTWGRMLERTEVEYADEEEKEKSEPEADGRESFCAGCESAQESEAEAAWWVSDEADEGGEDASGEGSEPTEDEARAESAEGKGSYGERVNSYWSSFWYFWRLCLSVYYRPGWYMSLGVHIGSEVELHLLWWIVILSSAEWARGMQEADEYYCDGIEPIGRE